MNQPAKAAGPQPIAIGLGRAADANSVLTEQRT
jgi:hypothetical protein